MPAPFDISLVQRGARLRRSPFFGAAQRCGAKAYTVYNDLLFPICFSSAVYSPRLRENIG